MLICLQPGMQEARPILDTPNDTSASNALEPASHKVHLRGLDSLTTKDIRDFATTYFEAHRPSHVEWIDDTSANLVYETTPIAQEALLSFVAVETDLSQISTLQTTQAKEFPLHPETKLQVRLAVVGDRKQAGARERSKFYLFNPEHDPAERRKKAGPRGPRTYRDRDDGGYRSQRYDDQEQQKREQNADFDVSLYDDDEGALAVRRGAKDDNRHGSPSGSETRSRDNRGARSSRAAGKELFPSRDGRGGGRLRDRSASPARDVGGDQDLVKDRIAERRRQSTVAASENRLKAQAIKARLKEASTTKELFPQKTGGHRQSSAFDVSETADLFATTMPVPFMDGSGDARPRSIASRITRGIDDEVSDFSIRGAAAGVNSQGFNIKGAAKVKELFPATLGDNAGKELFSERLEGRGRRRQKAEDLFY